MTASQNLSSLSCELRIIRARNTEFITTGNLFVRYYLVTGEDKRRVCLNTREIPSTSDPCWNEAITLECLGDDVVDKLKQQSIVFELRWRKSAPVFGKFGGSKLLFSAEVGWKDVLNSSESTIKKWVTSSTSSRYVPQGLKQPAVEIEMKIQDSIKPHMWQKCHGRSTKWRECGCGHGGCNGRDDDTFALAAASVAF